MNSAHAAPDADRRARPARDRGGDRGELLHPLRGGRAGERLDGLLTILPGFLLYAAVVYFFFRLHEAKWRFTSLPDLCNIVRASTVLAVSLLVLDYILVSPQLYGTFFFGKITIVLYWFLQIAFLAGTRIAYRYFRYVRTQQHARDGHAVPTLILGRAADAEVLLRAIESGAVKKIWPVGILSPSSPIAARAIRGVPVLGDFDDLEQIVQRFRRARARVSRG